MLFYKMMCLLIFHDCVSKACNVRSGSGVDLIEAEISSLYTFTPPLTRACTFTKADLLQLHGFERELSDEELEVSQNDRENIAWAIRQLQKVNNKIELANFVYESLVTELRMVCISRGISRTLMNQLKSFPPNINLKKHGFHCYNEVVDEQWKRSVNFTLSFYLVNGICLTYKENFWPFCDLTHVSTGSSVSNCLQFFEDEFCQGNFRTDVKLDSHSISLLVSASKSVRICPFN